LSIRTENKIDKISGISPGLLPGKIKKGAGKLIGTIFNGFTFRQNAVHCQHLDTIVDIAKRYISNSMRIPGDSGAQRAGSILDSRLAADFGALHHQIFKGAPGSRTLLAGEGVNSPILPSNFTPVDDLYNQVLSELVVLMMVDSQTIKQATQLLFVARFLERIADHATNVGEAVYFMVRGERKDLNQ
jgi:hypothetical protein